MTRRQPNFFIVGAAKSGTTSLYHYLRQHPQIFMPERKEPSFFMNWKGGVRSWDEYWSIFAPAGKSPAVGEASTGYLFAPEAVPQIKATFPNARIIMILRNPVDMCFALWRHMRRIGKRGEWLSFEAALEREASRMADPFFRAACLKSWHGNFYYFHRALYFEQVGRYLDAFGRERVQIHIFDEFKKDPIRICREAFGFLGVTKDFRPDIRMHNVGAEVRHRGLQKAITNPSPFTERITAFLPSKFYGNLKEWLRVVNRKPPPHMEPGTRRRLLEAYAPDVYSLGMLIGEDLGHWLKNG